MKTVFRIEPVVLLSFLFFGPAMGQAQSIFALCNEPSGGVNAPIFDAEGNPLGPRYLVELWGAGTPDSLVPAYAEGIGDRLIIAFLGGGIFCTTKGAVVPSIPTGSESWLQVRAWDSGLGHTYEEVAALDIGGYGESTLFYARGKRPGDMLGIPAPLIGLESFNLRPVVPEPSTWALLATRGVVLWLAAARGREP